MIVARVFLLALLAPGLAAAGPREPSALLKLRGAGAAAKRSEPRSAQANRQAVGALGAAYCYQFSATLDALSAGWQRGAYKQETLAKRVRQTQGVARAVRKSLRGVEIYLAGKDRETARGMIALSSLLIDEGDALVQFARARTSKAGKHYTLLRKRARTKLRELLAP